MKILFILFISLNTYAGMNNITQKGYGINIEQLDRASRKKQKKVEQKVVLRSAKNLNVKKKKRKAKQQIIPIFANTAPQIRRLERFYGLVDGNIKIIGSEVVPVKVYLSPKNKFKIGSYLSCDAYNRAIKYHYKIDFKCNYLVTDEKEYSVKAIIRDLRKIKGITPEHTSSGEEESIFKSLMAGIGAKLLDSSKERIVTQNGYQEVPNSSNALKESVIDTTKENVNKQANKEEKNIVLATFDQKKVIVEFQEPLKL